MKSFANRPRLIVKHGDALPLSGEALLDLMKAVLVKGRPFRFKAWGWSMTPFIRDGDVVTVAPLPAGPPGVGQIVAFVHPEAGKIAVHRINARRKGAFHLQGDNLPGEPDGWIPAQNLLGAVIRVERNGRPVRFGLGPERFVIAWFSRRSLLQPVLAGLGQARRRLNHKEQR